MQLFEFFYKTLGWMFLYIILTCCNVVEVWWATIFQAI
jgi:hypothetical protein